MDKEFKCDFYFGDQVDTPIKQMDINELSGYRKTVKNIKIFKNKYIWQKEVVSLVFNNYKYFILTGDHRILSNWVIAFLARLLNKKVLIWMHGLKSKRELHWKSKLKIYPFYTMSNIFLIYSDYSRNIMIKKGFNPQKMFCIYNSLDYNNQLQVRAKLTKTDIYSDHFKNNIPVLIYIGRIQRVKKIDLILVSMLILKQRGVNCNLVIVGENADELSFKKQISDAGLESNVWIYGPTYEEEIIGELIYNADVCVSPGNVGLTAMHCFTYGTPVITNDNFETQMPEFEVIESGLNGDFFEEDNIWDLSDKISNWIALEERKREDVRLSAYRIIDEKYNPQYQIEVLKKVLNQN
ncbi:MAG: glycosyltransferase family 4 protein [Candidatus Saccharimonadaceae bacterium]